MQVNCLLFYTVCDFLQTLNVHANYQNSEALNNNNNDDNNAPDSQCGRRGKPNIKD